MSDEEIKDEKTAQSEAVPEKPKRRGRKPKSESDSTLITGLVKTDDFEAAATDIEKDSMVTAEDVTQILATTMAQAYLEWSYPGLFKDKDSEDPVKDLVKAKVVFGDGYTTFKIFDVKTITNEDDIVDDSYQISLEDAQAIDATKKIGDTVEIPFDVTKLDKTYVRRVRQLFQSHLKDASRQAILDAYSGQIGGLIEGTVTKVDSMTNSYELSFGKAQGFLRRRDVIPQDHFAVGERVQVYLSDVSDRMNPPSLVISRANEKFVLELMKKFVPEIASGIVHIKAIAREAGRRTKVFVDSTDPHIDPVGTCLGPESSRIRSVLADLHGEKIDVLKYYSNKAMQVIEAMKPSTVIGLSCPEDFFDTNVHYDELEQEPKYEFPKITAVVMNGNQGVAIGTGGVNVRLATRLTMASISVLQSDDAIKQGLKYLLVPDIQKLVMPAVSETPAPEAKPVAAAKEEPAEAAEEESFASVESAKKAEAVKPAAPVAPVSAPVVAAAPAPVVAAPVAAPAPVEHVEIRNKPKISLEQLEEALTQKKGPSETHSYKKRWKHDDDKKEEVPSGKIPAVAPTTAMPIYTAEELKKMEENEKSGTTDQNGDDIDLDQYDSDKYYDGK